jgi:hypothetical protein
VDFGSNITIEAEGEFSVRNKDLPYDLDIAYTFDAEGGRFEMTAVTFIQRKKGSPLKSELVRKIALDRLLAQHLGRKLPRSSRRLMVRPPKLLSVYRAAYACHVGPTAAVAHAFGIPTGSAEQRVFKARTAGLLPQTIQGRAQV